MIDIHMLSDILKYGKMVLNVEPFFSLELEVNGPVKIVEADRTGTRMISADNTRLKARNLETEELMEYRVVLPLGDKEFDNTYELFMEAMFYCLRYIKKLLNYNFESIDFDSDPRTVGFFNKNTYKKIMRGSWAEDKVVFECEKMDGDISETRYASLNNMRREAVGRLKLLGVDEIQIKAFEKDGKVPYIDMDGDSIGKRYLTGTEQLMAYRLFAEMGYCAYYAISQKDYYMDGTEFQKVTFLVVTKYYKDWERSREWIAKNVIESYVVNLDIPEYSEFAEVSVENVKGILITKC